MPRDRWDFKSTPTGDVVEAFSLVPPQPNLEFRLVQRNISGNIERVWYPQLLPRDERRVECIQEDGPEPSVMKAKPTELTADVAAVATRLCDAHHPGTTAIIAIQTKEIAMELLRNGWRQDSRHKRVLEKDGRGIHILKPDSARGLEFDAVIVAEPGDFPPNMGRMGSLYTSLTRANRELAVVHSKPLPDALRKRNAAPSLSA